MKIFHRQLSIVNFQLFKYEENSRIFGSGR